MLSFLEYVNLFEGRSFKLDGKTYSSGFGRYSCDGKSISKSEYDSASKTYKGKNDASTNSITQQSNDNLNNSRHISYKEPSIPYRECKSVASCEKFIKEFSGVDVDFTGITDKRLTNIIAKGLHTVHSKYPALFQHGIISAVGSTEALKKKKIEELIPQFETNKVYKEHIENLCSSHIKKYPISAGMSLSSAMLHCGTVITSHEAKHYLEKLGYTKNDGNVTLSQNQCEKILEVFKERVKWRTAEVTVNAQPTFNGLENTIAFYTFSGSSNNSVGIYTVPKVFASAVNRVSLVKTNHFAEGCGPHTVMEHECGHAMDKLLDLRNNAEIQNLWKKYSDSKEISDGLSSYGASSIMEFIAVSFEEYQANKTPRKIASEVGTVIDKLYKDYEASL